MEIKPTVFLKSSLWIIISVCLSKCSVLVKKAFQRRVPPVITPYIDITTPYLDVSTPYIDVITSYIDFSTIYIEIPLHSLKEAPHIVKTPIIRQ